MKKHRIYWLYPKSYSEGNDLVELLDQGWKILRADASCVAKGDGVLPVHGPIVYILQRDEDSNED